MVGIFRPGLKPKKNFFFAIVLFLSLFSLCLPPGWAQVQVESSGAAMNGEVPVIPVNDFVEEPEAPAQENNNSFLMEELELEPVEDEAGISPSPQVVTEVIEEVVQLGQAQVQQNNERTYPLGSFGSDTVTIDGNRVHSFQIQTVGNPPRVVRVFFKNQEGQTVATFDSSNVQPNFLNTIRINGNVARTISVTPTQSQATLHLSTRDAQQREIHHEYRQNNVIRYRFVQFASSLILSYNGIRLKGFRAYAIGAEIDELVLVGFSGNVVGVFRGRQDFLRMIEGMRLNGQQNVQFSFQLLGTNATITFSAGNDRYLYSLPADASVVSFVEEGLLAGNAPALPQPDEPTDRTLNPALETHPVTTNARINEQQITGYRIRSGFVGNNAATGNRTWDITFLSGNEVIATLHLELRPAPNGGIVGTWSLGAEDMFTITHDEERQRGQVRERVRITTALNIAALYYGISGYRIDGVLHDYLTIGIDLPNAAGTSVLSIPILMPPRHAN